MKATISAMAFGALTLLGSQAALAFTYENQGTTQPTTSGQSQTKAGYLDTDPGSLMPPIGQSIGSTGYDFGPGAFNNGMAQQPTRGSSVGPSWLYPPGN
ncbi:hypothetical protein [Hyphomicrobium sp. LHD-15]|uniref:hypothetical protein n=1 Tax=Hyphomicrobium sp. LHD-15 TaxID=3072142 RepID=UPI0028101089|nr:hypothetical protein [Hyphomicrobium sp. LHD-15]MDQ8700119.1 hypothetical protein [Hyphomicrobium sp. LHD-15]